MPLSFVFFLGRRIGDFLFFIDLKHRAVVYANIKTAFEGKYSAKELAALTRKFYRAFIQNIVEILLVPKMNFEYIKKYVEIEGLENLKKAQEKNKGVIFVAFHLGSWEVANLVTANYKLPFWMFVRNQKFPKFNDLLNSYRISRGTKIVKREDQSRQLIKILKNNEYMAITADQGGRNGMLVKFFGKNASMSTGAVRLGLKYGASLLPVFSYRKKGPYLKLILDKPLDLKISSDETKDVKENLQNLIGRFETFIDKYPQEYLWTYKVWKYSDERKILILHDGKTGHLRQSEGLARIASTYLSEKNIKTQVETVQVGFKNKFCENLFMFSNILSGKYICQICQFCRRSFIAKDVCDKLKNIKADIVISCGSKTAGLNYLLSRENQAKSVVIMKPSFLSFKKYDLVVIPKHDNPAQRKNVIVTWGALNLIDAEYLEKNRKQLKNLVPVIDENKLNIGVLLGGDTKDFVLEQEMISKLLEQLKHSAQELQARLLFTTSRRTSKKIEDLVEASLKDFKFCDFLVIANKNNLPFAVGGILGYSNIVLISGESISMVSEAINSGKYVVVFDAPGLRKKHRLFLEELAANEYIYLTKPENIKKTIVNILKDKPVIKKLPDNIIVREALSKIL